MVDFLLDENGDLLIQNNDFVIGDATEQYIIDTLQASRGDYKANPQYGVGDAYFLNGPLDIQAKKQVIMTQLKLANVSISDVQVVPNADGSYSITPILNGL